jgi:hypothetical protein
MQTRSQSKKLVAISKEPLFKELATQEPVIKDTVIIESLSKEPATKDTVIIESPYRQPLYDVDIDFDEASIAWRANKKSIGNGQFKYKKWTKFNN